MIQKLISIIIYIIIAISILSACINSYKWCKEQINTIQNEVNVYDIYSNND